MIQVNHSTSSHERRRISAYADKTGAEGLDDQAETREAVGQEAASEKICCEGAPCNKGPFLSSTLQFVLYFLQRKALHEDQGHYNLCRYGAGILDFSFRIVRQFIRLIDLETDTTGFGIAGNFFLDDNVRNKYLM